MAQPTATPTYAYVTFRLPTLASKHKAEVTRHHERAQVRVGAVQSTAQAIAYRDRVNGQGYVGRAYQACGRSSDDPRTVVAGNGMRIRIVEGRKS